ncbi:MAG: phosphoglucomutase/phosphomannomutase family protein [Flavobacteriales bacterium]|nr:phosphoglucomutase/phosphomannomutase family protein [Flavobacteriales bacterium]
MKIKFGTDGWRAIIAKEFTVENVARVTEGACVYLKKHFDNPSVVIGHDCRFAGELFAETATKVFCSNGIKVHLAVGYVSTPMVSLATLKLTASLGVILTASHNPSSYSGYKLKGHYGGPLLEDGIKEVESYIPDSTEFNFDSTSLTSLQEQGLVEVVDLETMYCDHLEKNFDLDVIRNSNMVLAYDAMYGSGQNVIKRLLPNVKRFRCEHNPHFYGISPEPIMRNLGKFSEYIKAEGDIDCALVNDGDADRIGMMDGEGNYIDSHHIMLLLINYLYQHKGYKGKIATGFSSTVKIKQLCDHYGLELDVVHIGFKHICGIMLEEEVIMGGEESGGIAVQGHIPERDGIWNGMVIWEFMAKSGKTINELIQEVYDLVGTFAFERIDLTLPHEQKDAIVAKCRAGEYNQFGDYKVKRLDDLDGYKYILSESEWVMIRPSGTEPVLRTYAEGATQEDAFKILKACHDTILI